MEGTLHILDIALELQPVPIEGSAAENEEETVVVVKDDAEEKET